MSTDGFNRGKNQSFTAALLENLEDRLLLSTVSVGDTFVYREANGTLVRVDLNSRDITLGEEVQATGVGLIELMRWAGGDASDMPGVVYHENGTIDTIDGGATFRRLDDPRPVMTGLSGISGLAVSNNIIYAFDAATSDLVKLDAVTGNVTQNLGHVIDSVEGTFYWDIRAMTNRPNGDIIAIGFLVDSDAANPPALPAPAGPFLITISGTSLQMNVNPVVGARGGLVTVGGQPTNAGFTDMAIAPNGTIYATDGTILYGIGAGGAVFSQVTLGQNGMNAIEFLNGTLYGASGSTVYTINVATGECTALNGYLARNDLSDLTVYGNNLYGIFQVAGNGHNRLAMITSTAEANMDLFSVYIAQSDQYTTLAMTGIGETQQAIYIGDMQQNVDVFNEWVPTLNNILQYGTAANQGMVLYDDGNGTILRAPAGSGSVAIGGVNGIATTDVDVYSTGGFADTPYVASAVGNYPGGDIYAGIFQDPTLPAMDMGRILVSGTVAGSVTLSGSLDLIELGHLWGNIDVAYDVNNIVIRTDFARPRNDPVYPNNALITVGGVLREVDILGDSYGTINVDGGINIAARDALLVDYNTQPIWEMEFKPFDDPNDMYYDPNQANAIRRHWSLLGQLTTMTNDVATNSQFLFNRTGTMQVWGNLLEDQVNSDDNVDYYAITLMAGQTIRVDTRMGHITDPRLTDLHNVIVTVTDAAGNIMGSVSEETVEDQGFDSRGTTYEALTFTAPSAGVYYLRVTPLIPYPGDYTIFLNNSTGVSLGAVDVAGNFWPSYGGLGATYLYDIAVRNGNFGAFEVTGGSYATYAFVIGGGNLVSYRAGVIGAISGGFVYPDKIVCDGSIGLVANTTASSLDASIIAGATDGFYSNNAIIQNIVSLGDLESLTTYASPRSTFAGIWTTGSIGSMLVAGTVWGSVTIDINYDNAGPAGRLDLLRVGGDWGGLGTIGVPTLAHGVNSDIGMVTVAGDIYTLLNGDVKLLNAVSNSLGAQATIEDDGGARVTISPAGQLDDNGDPLYVDDQGNPVTPPAVPDPANPFTGTLVPSTYSYWVIPVDGPTGLKIGGVLARLTLDGPVTLTNLSAGNTADIGQLNAQGNGTVTLGGVGGINVYQVVGGANLDGFVNTTTGSVVCGTFGAMQTIRVQGNLGRVIGAQQQWLEGMQAAAAATQAGYFDRRINGLSITGDVAEVIVGGWLGDLMVSGQAASIIVNADHQTSSTLFDGVVGVVHAGTIGTINVGDGLADDGSGDRAIAAILSDGTIGSVLISGTGHWLNGSILALGDITSVVGTNGASDTAIIACVPLGSWSVRAAMPAGVANVGDVRFSGAGATISEAEIYGMAIGTIEASTESDGIVDSWFTGDQAGINLPGIAAVLAGGPGLNGTHLATNGGAIGNVRGTGPNSDIVQNFFDTTDSLWEVSGRRIYQNSMTIPGTVKKMAAKLDIFGNTDVNVGSILQLTCGTDFTGNYFTVATEITTARIGGNFSYSTLILRGPQGTRLGTLDVTGNISGTIEAAGSIGSIYSRQGLISATIRTLANPTSADVDLISTRNGYSGELYVAGNLRQFTSMATLGLDPSTISDYVPKRFDIGGNITTFSVRSQNRALTADMYTSLYVGGSIGSMDIAGSLYGNVAVNGNVTTLKISGDMGGYFNIPGPTRMGNLTVYGALTNFSLAAGANIIGDLTVGATIKSLTLNDSSRDPNRGNVIGNITSLYGSIERLTLTNGRLEGNLTASERIGTVSIRGTAGDPANVTGDIIAQRGGITSVTISNGQLDGDVRANGGDIGSLTIAGGSIGTGDTILAAGNIRKVQITGNFDGTVEAGGRLESLSVRGNFGSTPAGGITRTSLTTGSGIGTLQITGSVGNAQDDTVWNIDGEVNRIAISGDLTKTRLGVRGDMANVDIRGTVANSLIVGGVVDVLPLHSSNLKSLSAGAWDSSLVVLGVGAGADGIYGTPDDATQLAPGLSSLGRMTVRGAIIGGNANRVIVDTGVGTVPAAIPVTIIDGGQPVLDPAAEVQFTAGKYLASDGVQLVFSGPGQGSYNPLTGALILNNTTSRSSLALSKTGAPENIQVIAGDDASLSSLKFAGAAMAGDITLDGMVNTFAVGAAMANAAWTLSGGIGNFTATSTLTNVTLDAGAVKSATIRGSFSSGHFTADSLASLTVQGNLTGPVQTAMGSLGRISVTGTASGAITSAYGLSSLTASVLAGDVTVQGGDIGSISVRGDVTANIEATLGYIKSIQITNGSFSSLSEDKAIRSLTGIGTYRISASGASAQPRYSAGLISTNGTINSISASGITFRSRVRAADGITNASLPNMVNALLASGTDIGTVTISGDMTNSDIVSGFDPGDAGYDANHGGNAANVRFDARTTPSAWVTPGNTDRLAGGDIRQVTIRGSMIASTIAAGIGPGLDGWFFTGDDQVRGNGLIGRVTVGGSITGSLDPTQSFGIFAAGALPKVSVPTPPTGNAHIASLQSWAGSPRVAAVQVDDTSVTIVFTGNIDLSTINNPQMNPLRPTTFDLIVSQNSLFGDADDYSITDNADITVTYDSSNMALKLTLVSGTWNTLNKGTNFLLNLDGSVVADQRGNLLDGEAGSTFPSGDGVPGGDFKYRFAYGDSGDTLASSTNLTAGIPILWKNQPLLIRQTLGDNDLSGNYPFQDVDYFTVDVHAGDILYTWCPSQVIVDTTSPILEDSLSGYGQRATADGSVVISVSFDPLAGYLGPYELHVLLFNDGDSNFTFDDSTQTATPLTWVGNTAQPREDQQTIIAPDDVDLFSLGTLPAYTRLDLSLDTLLIGSSLTPKMAVFNSAGDKVGVIDWTSDMGSEFVVSNPSITLTGSVLTPALDTYYVAVADETPVSADQQITGSYQLTVTKTQQAEPVWQKQLVYVNFNGGVADYLLGYGNRVNPYQQPLSASTFGFSASRTQDLINAVMDTIRTVYQDYHNIEFTTIKPMIGDYSTLYISNDLAFEAGLLGIAQDIDPDNSDHTDNCTVFAGEYASSYNASFGNTIEQIGKAIGNTAAHEFGHCLGLNHVQNDFQLVDPITGEGVALTHWVMGYGFNETVNDPNYDLATATFGTHVPIMKYPSAEFLIGYQNSVAELWTIK